MTSFQIIKSTFLFLKGSKFSIITNYTTIYVEVALFQQYSIFILCKCQHNISTTMSKQFFFGEKITG